ncbi:hypothetical protein GOBAR_DD03915 [Gossypium barbadense]|nr:hypothetical protein GOBAR_DD03915 [Gossypium barbadense]
MQCLDDQRSPLLQLQHHLYYDPYFTFSFKFELWHPNTDCCSWEGVTCDAYGHVVGIDLSYKNLSGSFHPIFNLHRLQRLNLAGNNFNTTLFSYGFDKLQNLTHLNLSSSCFHGQIPVEISFLKRLVPLDLSNQNSCYLRYDKVLYPAFYNSFSFPYELQQPLKLENPNFKTLIKNLRFLTELYLDGVNISTQSAKWCETTSLVLSNLRVLSLSYCGLKGPLCSSLSRLSFLSKLILDLNPISYLPPNFLEISPRLVSLSLRNCNLSGHFPTEILLSPKIQSIDISANDQLMGQLPEFPANNALLSLSLYDTNFSGKLPQSIELSYCKLFGPIPSSIANLSHLVNFDISNNYLTRPIPKSILQLPRLERIYIESNSFSSMKLDMFSSLSSLNLSFNVIDFPKKLPLSDANFSFPMLGQLLLESCNISAFPEFLKSQENLEELDLSNNKISGAIPNWVWKKSLRFSTSSQTSLTRPICNLSQLRNFNFSGELSIDFLQPTRLRSLKIGGNKLEGKLSRSLANCKALEVLDLGNNMVHDTFPFWLEKLPSLKVVILFVFPTLDVLDIASNQFSGDLSIEFLQSLKAMMQLTNEDKAKLDYIGENYYQDSVTIFNKGIELFYEKILATLTCLDLSSNSFHGRIPEEIQMLRSLKVLNLSYNSFSGEIPVAVQNLKDLESLDLSQNELSGKIPPQLTTLTFLEVLNLSYNPLS